MWSSQNAASLSRLMQNSREYYEMAKLNASQVRLNCSFEFVVDDFAEAESQSGSAVDCAQRARGR